MMVQSTTTIATTTTTTQQIDQLENNKLTSITTAFLFLVASFYGVIYSIFGDLVLGVCG